MFAILNKIADTLRKRSRTEEVDQLLREDGGEQSFDELFNERGYWHAAERPARQARVFMMREFVELESREVCAAVDITVRNLNVTLHRARLRLRECLENNWFLRGESLYGGPPR